MIPSYSLMKTAFHMRRSRYLSRGFPRKSVIIRIIYIRATPVGTVSARDNTLTITDEDRRLVHDASLVVDNLDGASSVESSICAHGIYLIVSTKQTYIFSAHRRALVGIGQITREVNLLPSKSVVTARQIKRLVFLRMFTIIVMSDFSVSHSAQTDIGIGWRNTSDTRCQQIV